MEAESTQKNQEDIKNSVKSCYGSLAYESSHDRDYGNVRSCCGSTCTPDKDYIKKLGYTDDELKNIPENAMLGLGCGNPSATAQIKEGDVVLDLGSGAGFDCFLVARKVGASGHVIGIDMTQNMIDKARKIAQDRNYTNVEFRLGEIEALPVEDNSVDLIISNCVVNLSTNKSKVYQEAFRVLKLGGKIAISDIVATSSLPEAISKDLSLYNGCMAGASSVQEVENYLKTAGFSCIQIKVNESSRQFIEGWEPTGEVKNYVASALIQATKPGPKQCCQVKCC